MKFIMQTRGDMRRFRTHLLNIPNLEIVCHTDEQATRINAIVPDTPIYVHELDEGVKAIGPVRDWVEKNLVAPNEWFVLIDDNINAIYAPDEPLYSQEKIEEEFAKRSFYRARQLQGAALQDVAQELVDRCEQQGTIYGGFGWMDNPGFRRTKWQRFGYVKAKMCVKKNTGLRWCWDPRIQVMYDHSQSFKVIEDYGSIAVNRYVYVDHPPYEVGGIGSHAERMPFRKPTQDFLYAYFRGLVTPFQGDYDKPYCRLHTQKSIDAWRAQRHGNQIS